MAEKWPHLQSLQEGGGDAPCLVLVPGLVGHGICFRHLAVCAPVGVRVLALDLPGADPREEPLQLSVETIADLLEPQIRAELRGNAVVFGGFSFGSLVGLELALRWQRRQEPVRGLVALDGYAPGYTSRKAPPSAKLASHVRALRGDPRHLGQLVRNAASDTLGLVGLEWLLADELEAQGGLAARHRARRLSAMRVRAERAYRRHERFAGPACLIRIAQGEHASGLTDLPDYGWGAYATDLFVHVLSGPVRHASFFAHPSARDEMGAVFWRWFAARLHTDAARSA